MAKSKTTKVVSKKHLARLERERRQIRIITISSIIILTAVFASILYGILNETVLLNYKPIITVNGDSVSVREFQARTKAARQQLINQYIQYYQLAIMFGMDPTTDSSLSQTFNSIQQQLDDSLSLGQQVMTNIEDDLVILQYARANGITVTADEVQNSIEDAYGYYPNGTPTPTLSATSFSYPTLSGTQLFLMTATPTLTPTITATPGPTNTLAPTVAPSPTATPLTEQAYTDVYKQGLDYYQNLGISEAMFRKVFFEYSLYRDKVKAAVTADVPHETEQVWARHILVSDQSTAETVHDLLLVGGDWNTLASTYSTDTATKDKGGDLGWFAKGTQSAEFEAVAFSLQIGEISEPVQTGSGYEIIQVLGHENRTLTADQYKTAVDNAFNTWLSDQINAATIVTNPNWLNYEPTSPTLQEAFTSMYTTQTAMAPTYLSEQQTQDAILALTPSATPLPPTATPPAPTATP
jgi:peptidyl-prolyl cis-trans isomerase D